MLCFVLFFIHHACSNLDPLDTILLSCHQETDADGIPKTVQRRETLRPEMVSTMETSSTVGDALEFEDKEASSRRRPSMTSRPPCDEGEGASLTENSEAGEDEDERERRREFEAGGVEEGATWGRQANSWRSRVVSVRFC